MTAEAAANIDDSIKRKRIRVSPNGIHFGTQCNCAIDCYAPKFCNPPYDLYLIQLAKLHLTAFRYTLIDLGCTKLQQTNITVGPTCGQLIKCWLSFSFWQQEKADSKRTRPLLTSLSKNTKRKSKWAFHRQLAKSSYK